MNSEAKAVAVTLDSVSKTFDTDAGEVKAVDDVSLEIAAGESLAVVGPSGCGKSTLLSMIGALEPPTSGHVWIDGEQIASIAEEARAGLRRRRIGFVFQSDNLQPFLTTLENVSFALALSGLSGAEHEQRPLQLLSSLGLGGMAEKFPDQLSGGERQRVAVARALVHSPGLILADEPTGSLDTESSSTVIDLLEEAQAKTGATLVVITHDPIVAARLDRKLSLADGRIVGEGTGIGAASGVGATPADLLAGTADV